MGVGRDREKLFDNLAWWLHRRGVRPNHVSVLQIPVYAAMLYVGYGADVPVMRWNFLALQVLAFVIDGADGILARRTGTVSRRGHLVDEFFDIAGIGITIWVVIIHHQELSQWLYGLLFVNFLVYIQNEIQGTKNITYTRGPLTLGFALELYAPGLLIAGLALPLVIGVVLLFTRVAWRKRLWTYYQYLTAGRRREYKAVPKAQRLQLLSDNPQLSARTWPRPPTQSVEEKTEGEATSDTKDQ